MQVNYELKKSIRGAFGEELKQLGEKYPNIVVLDADLSGSTKTSVFAKAFPDRFFDVGIAEQDLITTALGLSLTGKIPFVASFAVFVTGRAYDQIRNSVCYQNGNVKIIGAHGGITVGEDGASHQALEDISLMRGLPNMLVICPSDYEQTKQVVDFAALHKGPVYIRLSRIEVPCIYGEDYKFSATKAVVLKEGKDLTLIATGDILSEVLKAAEILESNGIDAEIINTPVIKPLDSATIINSVSKTGFTVTVENHSVIGGLGSAVCECLCESFPAQVLRIGINDVFGQSGQPAELLKHYGLDSESIANRIIELKR